MSHRWVLNLIGTKCRIRMARIAIRIMGAESFSGTIKTTSWRSNTANNPSTEEMAVNVFDSSAYARGKRDRKAGKSLCPYNGNELREAWNAGFDGITPKGVLLRLDMFIRADLKAKSMPAPPYSFDEWKLVSDAIQKLA